MSRVMAQGDFRPMSQNREAMTDLVAILEARRADYARAEAELDTSGDSVEQSFAKLLQVVTKVLGRDASPPSPRVRGEDRDEGASPLGSESRQRPLTLTRSARSTSPRAAGRGEKERP